MGSAKRLQGWDVTQLSLIFAGQPGRGWLQKRSFLLAGLPKRTARLGDCCTAAWGNELTVRGQGSPARDTFPLAEATNIIYTEPGLEREGGKVLV